MLEGGRHEEASLGKPLANYGNRVNDIFQIVGEVEEDIRINGDELWPVWSRRHSRASGIPLRVFRDLHPSTCCPRPASVRPATCRLMPFQPALSFASCL